MAEKPPAVVVYGQCSHRSQAFAEPRLSRNRTTCCHATPICPQIAKSCIVERVVAFYSTPPPCPDVLALPSGGLTVVTPTRTTKNLYQVSVTDGAATDSSSADIGDCTDLSTAAPSRPASPWIHASAGFSRTAYRNTTPTQSTTYYGVSCGNAYSPRDSWIGTGKRSTRFLRSVDRMSTLRRQTVMSTEESTTPDRPVGGRRC